MQRRALILSTAISGASSWEEPQSERHQQFERGLAAVLDLVEGLSFKNVLICDNTVANVSDLPPEIAKLVNRIPSDQQFLFCKNDLGLLNKGAGVIEQLDRVLPILQANYDQIIFFEPRQKIRNTDIFLRILESNENVFKVRKWFTLRRGFVPWIHKEVHTGFFSLSTSGIRSFVDSHSPSYMVMNNLSLEREMFLHFRSGKFSFESVPELGITRTTGLVEVDL